MSSLFHGYKKLKSGDLTFLYKEGEIRQVCLGRIQVLNAIYAAVRDQNWTTVPFKVLEESIEETGDGFHITLALEYSLEKIHYKARMSIEAKGNKLLVNYDGEAGSSFLRNRIGLCILHPIKECRGEAVLITHPDGSQSEGRFPELISPDQPFFNISGMYWNPGKGIDARLNFEGEIFESEDQRNWTDASYKTYCTPLNLPFPAKVEKGDQVHQSVSLVVKAMANSDQPSTSDSGPFSFAEKRIISLIPDRTSPLPGLGIGRSTETNPLTLKESEVLSALPFHHYRMDLHLYKEGWKDIYDCAVMEQHQLGWPLELALHFGTNPGQELEAFLDQYSLQPVNIRHLLVFDKAFLSNKKLLKQVVPSLRASIPNISVGGGADANFAELNRFPPDPDLIDFVSFSICPQIHAKDNLTLVENLEAQQDSVSSALSLLDKAVSIGAITLKQRFNAVATDDEDESQAIPESDPRQHTPFIAGWTLGSLGKLAMSGADSLTYFETVGPRGILSRHDESGGHSPLFHLFEEVLSGEYMLVIHTTSSHPLEFDGLALQGQTNSKLLIANYSEDKLSIEISGLHGSVQNTYQLDKRGWTALEDLEPRKHGLTMEPLSIYKITYPQ